MRANNSTIWKGLFDNLPVIRGGKGNYSVYFCPDSIKPSKGIWGIRGVNILTLEDYTFPQKSSMHSSEHLSFSVHQEFNLKQPKKRIHSLSFHSKNLSKGDVIFSAEVEPGWCEIEIGSVDFMLWENLTLLFNGK